MATQSQPREGRGIWKDEKRSPGYLPQGRRRPLALLAVVAFGVLWRVFLHHHIPKTALGVFVILVGLGSFYGAAKMNQKRLAEERYVRGPGWWLGWLISKTSVGFARGFYIALGIGICGLGLAELLFTGHKTH
jgi:uncharacterized membrane protein YfcA